MARTTNMDLIDRLLDGQLRPMLEAWAKEGLSYDEIAFRLRRDHDIKLSRSTVGRWLHSLGIDQAEAVA